jgi:magnesium transporter
MAKTASATRALVGEFLQRYPDEAARALSEIEEEEVLGLLERQPVWLAVQVFAQLNPDLATRLLERMDQELFRRLFAEMDLARAAILLSRLDEKARQIRLQWLDPPDAEELRELMTYPPDAAGYIMDPEVMMFRGEETVSQALSRLRRQRSQRITDLCLVDGQGRLEAVLPLQEVAVAPPGERLGALVQGPLISVQGASPREEVVELMETKKLASLPVVDFEGRLLGIIRHDVLVEAVQRQASEDIQAMVGAGRGERALSGVSFVVRKRLPWLQINLATAFLAAAVVGLFEDTIALFTTLAIFLPVVAGQSGNTGAQALAVTMRGLALRELRLRSWPRVVGKEMAAGLINGCAVAMVTGAAAYLYSGSPGLLLVLSISMVFSMMMAALSGAVIPMLLTALRQDPAQSASIILTTVTDVVGFMSFLGLATLLYRHFAMAI